LNSRGSKWNDVKPCHNINLQLSLPIKSYPSTKLPHHSHHSGIVNTKLTSGDIL